MNNIRYIKVKDSPKWVQVILKERSIARDVKLMASATGDISSNWCDSNMRTFYFYSEGSVKRYSESSYDSIAFSSKFDQEARLNGTSVGFNSIDQMILVVESYPKGATLIAHPDALVKMLPEPELNLSKEELTVLDCIKMYNSPYRRSEALYQGVSSSEAYDEAIISLKGYGLLNKAGALTTLGKNLVKSKYY